MSSYTNDELALIGAAVLRMPIGARLCVTGLGWMIDYGRGHYSRVYLDLLDLLRAEGLTDTKQKGA